MGAKALLASLAAGLLLVAAGLYFFAGPARVEEVKETDASPLPAPAAASIGTQLSSATEVQTAVGRSRPPAPKTGEQPFRPATGDLSARIESARAALPTVAQLRTLKAEELHRTPEPVRQANALIGEVAEAVAASPARAGEALSFYGDCARRGDVATSVRALCLTRMRELAPKAGLPAEEDGIDADVKRISDLTLR